MLEPWEMALIFNFQVQEHEIQDFFKRQGGYGGKIALTRLIDLLKDCV